MSVYETALASIRAPLERGETVLGMSVRSLRTPDVARIARASGHDFLFIDTQHALITIAEIASIAHAALSMEVAPLVRCRSVEDPDVPALLDGGVTGIVFPDIETPEQARRAVERCKYPPLGRRSLGGSSLTSDFRAEPPVKAMARLNEATVVVCMIESLEGLENVEAIAAVEGVDVLHLGTNDLLLAMGKPGQFDAVEIVAAQERVFAAALAHGKYAGCGGARDVARQRAAISAGARFLTTHTDVGFLLSAAGTWTAAVRSQG